MMIESAALERRLASMGRVLLGYSGGVDSALLAVVATETVGADRFLAVIGRSASYPAVQWRTAQDVARRFSIPLREIETHELDDPNYRANPTDRCYYCKAELWGRMGRLACELEFDTIVDGTNADDLTEHRPGLKAAAEFDLRSPLAELGWTNLGRSGRPVSLEPSPLRSDDHTGAARAGRARRSTVAIGRHHGRPSPEAPGRPRHDRSESYHDPNRP